MLTVSEKEIIFSIMVTGLKGGEYTLTVTTSNGLSADANVIIIDWDLDTDGDGICDYWETYGIDTNDDGKLELDLKSMGADPNTPDIFVEIDWMVRPAKKFLFWETKSSYSFKPSESIMRTVYNSFKSHGINIHLDVGADSTDFVTGKKWGSLSGGNEVEYTQSLNVDRDYQTWNNLLDISEVRTLVFHHCLFADTLTENLSGAITKTTSGITPGFGQYFAVTLGGWGSVDETTIAGTFMHELGHSLGLRHGGCDNEHYKPNYLSVMNYAFQTTGLAGTGSINYSDYKLPDIDESSINEFDGVDPSSLTSGTNLATTIFYRTSSQMTTGAISGAAIDFNRNGTLERSISLDLNPGGNVRDSEIAVLKGHNDWNGINYCSGIIGSGLQTDDIPSASISAGTTYIEEKTLEESLETSTLAVDGTGSLEIISPTVIYGVENQNIYFDVINLGAEDTYFKVTLSSELFDKTYQEDIFVCGSQDKIESTRISVSVDSELSVSEHTIFCTISSGKFSDKLEQVITIYEPTYEELVELKNSIDEAENVGSIDKDIINEMSNVVENSDVLSCSCICHQTGFMRFIYIFIRLFWVIFGTNNICACGMSHK